MHFHKILFATDFSPASETRWSLPRLWLATGAAIIAHIEEMPMPYAGGECISPARVSESRS